MFAGIMAYNKSIYPVEMVMRVVLHINYVVTFLHFFVSLDKGFGDPTVYCLH